MSVLLLCALASVSVALRRGDLVATSVRYQYPNESVGEWQHARTADSPRFGVRGRTYLHVSGAALGLRDTVKAQFQFTEPHRRHFSTTWLTLSGDGVSLADAVLTFVHTDDGHLVRVDLDALQYVAVDGTDQTATKDTAWHVRHTWQLHTAVDRESGFTLLLASTFAVALLSAAFIFISSFRSFHASFAVPVAAAPPHAPPSQHASVPAAAAASSEKSD